MIFVLFSPFTIIFKFTFYLKAIYLIYSNIPWVCLIDNHQLCRLNKALDKPSEILWQKNQIKNQQFCFVFQVRHHNSLRNLATKGLDLYIINFVNEKTKNYPKIFGKLVLILFILLEAKSHF